MARALVRISGRLFSQYPSDPLVGVARIERATLCLKGRCSTTELHTLSSQSGRHCAFPINRDRSGLHAAPLEQKSCSSRLVGTAHLFLFVTLYIILILLNFSTLQPGPKSFVNVYRFAFFFSQFLEKFFFFLTKLGWCDHMDSDEMIAAARTVENRHSLAF